jgi:FixJ family two-component response regulator
VVIRGDDAVEGRLEDRCLEQLAHPRRVEAGGCARCVVRYGSSVSHRGLAREDMPIIFITGHGDIPTSVRAMKAGAVEFLTKPLGDDVLLTAIRDTIDRSRTALEREAEMQALRTCYASLSRREREVMARVVAGRLKKQAAADLGISEITVKAHRGRVTRKMHADSVADLVRTGANLGLDHAPRCT